MTPDAETILWSRLVAAENAIAALKIENDSYMFNLKAYDRRIAELESARLVQIKLNTKFEEATKVKPERKPWWPF